MYDDDIRNLHWKYEKKKAALEKAGCCEGEERTRKMSKLFSLTYFRKSTLTSAQALMAVNFYIFKRFPSKPVFMLVTLSL